MTTGIVSEICLGILESSENDFLNYPIKVAIHVMERSTSGEIMRSGCTVNTGTGSWVLAKNANFSFISEPLPYQYQQLESKEIQQLLKNIFIYSNKKLAELNNKIGIFNP